MNLLLEFHQPTFISIKSPPKTVRPKPTDGDVPDVARSIYDLQAEYLYAQTVQRYILSLAEPERISTTTYIWRNSLVQLSDYIAKN